MQKSSQIKLTIVILNFNTRELVLDCLSSIKNSQEVNFPVKIIVVDNASSDGSGEELQKLNWLTLIENPENRGFSAGNNTAVSKFAGKYVWFLNPDTVLEPKTLVHMVDFMDKHPDVGIATPKLTLTNGSFDKNCHRGFPTPWNSFCHFSGLDALFPKSRLFAGYYLGFIAPNIESEVDVIGGSSVLIRRQVGNKIKWWSEHYFMYGEDIDLAFRVKQAGFKVMYVPSALIHHYHGASSGLKKSSHKVTKATRETKIRSAQAGIDAMKTFYGKFYREKYPKIVTKAVLTGISLLGSFRIIRLRIFP